MTRCAAPTQSRLRSVKASVTRGSAVRLACAASIFCGLPSSLSAQEVQLRHHAGLHLPSTISLQNGTLHVRQKFGVKLGMSLTLTFNQRFDIVSGVTYIPGYAMLRGAGKQIQIATASHQLSTGVRARYWLLPPPRKFSWDVYTGVGMATGGRQDYEDFFENSTLSGTLGTALRYQIGRMVNLQLRIQQRLYRLHLGSGEPGTSRKPLRVSFGLELPFLQLVSPEPYPSQERFPFR